MFRSLTAPVPVLRLEGLALLGIGIYAFTLADVSWWWFALFLLVPDVSMIGYLQDPGLGATIYNIGHSMLGPVLLFAWSWAGGPDVAFATGAIWLSHIGMDRMFGYGLKYGDDFTHTHLGTIGLSD